MKFPAKEADVMMLAEQMSAGFSKNSSLFPTLPVSIGELKGTISSCILTMNNCIAARAALDKASEAKKVNYEKLVGIMKKELRYAENTASGDEAMLATIGWSVKKTATPMTPPEACYSLTVEKEGKGWLSLSWKKADKGGKPSAYTIEKRTQEGDWEEVGSAVETKKDLVDQPRGLPIYYRVVGFNKAGTSAPSNTVEVTL